MSDFDFDFDAIEDFEFGVLPPGDYPVMLDEAELVDTKAGDGKYMKAKFRVFEGVYANRILFHNFNIYNKNEKAQNIGRAQLKQFGKACGLNQPKNPHDFIGYKVMAKIKVHKDETYGEQNKIAGFNAYSAMGVGNTLKQEQEKDLLF